MGCSGLLVLVLVLVLVLTGAPCLDCVDPDGDLIETTPNVTAVLGEDVYLSCRYLGDSEIHMAEWKRQTKSSARRMAGFQYGRAFNRSGFSQPDSPTNLTVRMSVSSVDVEGTYVCEFESDEDSVFRSVSVTVVARPEVQVLVRAETVNTTHYQSVSCSAVGGRPTPHISWWVGGLPPSGPPFTEDQSQTLHPDGTSTLSSTLRFPTRLQDQESVTCEVRHPALPQPALTTARVETYVRPDVAVEAEMVEDGGSDLWVVSCVSSGGRPDTDMVLVLNTSAELQQEEDSDSRRVSVRLPAAEYQGHDVTCVFNHPKFTHEQVRVTTLPVLYLSEVRLQSESDGSAAPGPVELQEGALDAVVSLQVSGNVPRYNVSCTKDEEPLPEGVELLGRGLRVLGPVQPQHAGLYRCVFSYLHLQAALQFNVTVSPPVLQLVAPTVRVSVWTEGGRSVMACSAADGVPAAAVSWLLPEGVSEDVWFNSTSSNGTQSVSGLVLLAGCSARELSAQCVINHPVFEEPETRSVPLPLCAPPTITMTTSSDWTDGHKHMKVDCSVESVAPAAEISWWVGDGPLMDTEVQVGGSVSARSSVHFPASRYAGQNLTCVVKHPSLEAPEKRTTYIPVHNVPLLTVSVVRLQDSPLWLAVCDCRGEGLGSNLAWVLPEETRSLQSLDSESEGDRLRARLTYRFPLELHEGQDLTCRYRFEGGTTEQKTLHIPRYYISSVRVLNLSAPLRSRHGDGPVVHRVSLQEKLRNQRILLRVEGNVPDYTLTCQRSDGSLVHMDGAAMMFQWEPTDRDQDLYTCRASFYHHTATVRLQVELTDQDQQPVLLSMIFISSASAISIFLIVVLCVCCKRSSRTENKKKKDSLAALTSLMQEPGSPEVTEKDRKEYAQLVSYSIVIDVKSTV